MSDTTAHTAAAQRHYPAACLVAEQFGHALRMHRSYGAECVHCLALFAESDAEAMASPFVGDAEAREIAGAFARECPGKRTAPQYVSPLSLSPETRAANLAALNARMERATARVMADPSQPKHVRDAARRDNATARRVAR